jgi:hypothetical protein
VTLCAATETLAFGLVLSLLLVGEFSEGNSYISGVDIHQNVLVVWQGMRHVLAPSLVCVLVM